MEPVMNYHQPASCWQEAFPLGNGRLGAMVLGDPGHEELYSPVVAWRRLSE